MLVTKSVIDVRVWSLDVSDETAGSLQQLLSDDERARARRLVKPLDAAHFIAGRAGLRQILGAATGVPANAVVFSHSPFGKPLLGDHRALHFNLSHSHGLAVVAISRQGPVGIDLEHVRPLMDGIEEEFLGASELEAFRGLAPEDRTTALVSHWAAKEAVIKFYGDIRKVDPKDIELKLDLHARPTIVRPAHGSGCSLVSLEVQSGYVCMLASGQPVSMQDIVLAPGTGVR